MRELCLRNYLHDGLLKLVLLRGTLCYFSCAIDPKQLHVRMFTHGMCISLVRFCMLACHVYRSFFQSLREDSKNNRDLLVSFCQ